MGPPVSVHCVRSPWPAFTRPNLPRPALAGKTDGGDARSLKATSRSFFSSKQLCTNSNSNSPRQRTADNSPAVHCWDEVRRVIVVRVSGRLKRREEISTLSVVVSRTSSRDNPLLPSDSIAGLLSAVRSADGALDAFVLMINRYGLWP